MKTMPKPQELIEAEEEIRKLRKINAALMERVERSMDQQGSAYSLFQTAINLEGQVKRRTSELTATLAYLEKSNAELKKAIGNAERANRSKTQFLAAASHDVLQPLNAATLLINSLTTVQSNDEGHLLCEQVSRSLDNMDTLLRTLLYMSRLDAGDIKPIMQCVSLDELFDSIATVFKPLAEQKNLVLRFRPSQSYVHTDPDLLLRILQNIVSNAIRYTPNGGVMLGASSVGPHTFIRIADTGVGIKHSEQKNVFVEFHRSHHGVHDRENASEGLGLGLAIVQRMVSALGHELTLSSTLNKGSCFRLTLNEIQPSMTPGENFVKPLDNRANIKPADTLNDTQVLLIENDFEVMQAMEALLGRWGCRLRLASSTEEALNTLGNDNWKPDLIVADQHLDGADLGTSTIELVRTLSGTAVPAIIITANPSRALAEEAKVANIEVMLKPVKPSQLRALMSHMRTQSDGGRFR